MSQQNSLLFIVANSEAAPYLLGLGLAASRQNVKFSVFFTGEGVSALADNNPQLTPLINAASEVIVCEHAWKSRQKNMDCPVTMGSQTDNSRLIGAFDKVISL